MSLSSTTFWESAREAACQVALEVWAAIEPFYMGNYTIQEKVDGPCTEADRMADKLIVERLRILFPSPEFGFLTEESEDNKERLGCKYVWIIDPIDGTKEFIKKSGNFVIHIGLVEQMEDGLWHPVASAVYRPVAGDLYSAVKGQGARRQHLGEVERQLIGETGRFEGVLEDLGPGEELRVSQRAEIGQMRSVVSNAYDTSRLMRLIQSLALEDYWRMGSLGIKLCTIAEGGAELYVNLGLGKSKEWDTCAPMLILTEAGGVMTDLDGAPLHFNRPDVYHHRGLVASNGLVHDMLLDLVKKFIADNPPS